MIMSTSTSHTELGIRQTPETDVLSSLLAAVVFSAQGLLLALAAAFFARRVFGGFLEPASGSLVCLAALTLGIAATGYRGFLIGWSFLPRAANDRVTLLRALVLYALPSIVSLLVLLALTLPFDRPAWLVGAAAWLMFAAVEALTWRVFYRRVIPRSHAVVAAPAVTAVRAVERERIVDSDSLPSDVIQQLTRTRDEMGIETIAATVRVDFPTGDRQQVVHLAFCPPLEGVPTLELEPLDGPEAELKSTLVQSYGVRIEARLLEAAEGPQSLLMQIYATTQDSE